MDLKLKRGGMEVVIATVSEWVMVGWIQRERVCVPTVLSGSSSSFFHDAAVFHPFIQQAPGSLPCLAPVQLFAVSSPLFCSQAAGSAAVCLTATRTAWRVVKNTPLHQASFHIFSLQSCTGTAGKVIYWYVSSIYLSLNLVAVPATNRPRHMPITFDVIKKKGCRSDLNTASSPQWRSHDCQLWSTRSSSRLVRHAQC